MRKSGRRYFLSPSLDRSPFQVPENHKPGKADDGKEKKRDDFFSRRRFVSLIVFLIIFELPPRPPLSPLQRGRKGGRKKKNLFLPPPPFFRSPRSLIFFRQAKIDKKEGRRGRRKLFGFLGRGKERKVRIDLLRSFLSFLSFFFVFFAGLIPVF